jgi:hypothetical protein
VLPSRNRQRKATRSNLIAQATPFGNAKIYTYTNSSGRHLISNSVHPLRPSSHHPTYFSPHKAPPTANTLLVKLADPRHVSLLSGLCTITARCRSYGTISRSVSRLENLAQQPRRAFSYSDGYTASWIRKVAQHEGRSTTMTYHQTIHVSDAARRKGGRA